MGAGGAAGMAAVMAAKKKREQEQEEEERLTTYRSDELDGWEFKIVRSATGAFKKRDTVEKLRSEEAQAGWEMVEKFDDSRVRFKRRTDRRANDHYVTIDPYRTSYGFGEGRLAAIVIITVVIVVGIAVTLAVTFAR